MRDEKLHAVVARSTFPSQNAQSTPCPDHFWKLRCGKSARRCGAKHISKSKCTKTLQLRSTFRSCDVEKVHGVVVRSTFPSQNAQSTPCSDHFWKLRCGKSARRCGAKFPSQNAQSTPCSDHFWKLRCGKSARRCGAKRISKSNCTKTLQLWSTFRSCDVEKVHGVVARSTFRSQNVERHQGFGPLLDVQMWFRVAGAKDCGKLVKSEQNVRVL